MALHLSFYWEGRDSYRDICLKQPRDGKEHGYHKKKMSELISTLLILRDEIVCDSSLGLNLALGEEVRLQRSTTFFNTLQVLPLPERPTASEVVMGCLPQSNDIDQMTKLSDLTIDPDYEKSHLTKLIRIWDDIDKK